MTFLKILPTVLLTAAAMTSFVNAADITWNNAAGTGKWNTTDANWDNGSGNIAWDNTANAGDIALFNSSLTLEGTITLGGLKRTAAGTYTITGGTLNFGAATGAIDISAIGTSGSSIATVASNLTGTGGVTIASGGNMSATGGDSGALTTFSGTNTGLTGDITITSGLVSFASNAAAGAASANAGIGNKIILNGGGLLRASSSSVATMGNNIEIGAAGGTLRAYGSQTLTLNGTISGSGTLNKTDLGTIILANNDGTAFSGRLNVLCGTVQMGNTGGDYAFNFSGNAISVSSGATLAFGGSSGGNVTHTYNFTNLTAPISVSSGTIAFTSANTTTKAFNAALDFSGNSTISYLSASWSNTINFNNTVTGTGTLNLTWGTAGATGRTINFAGDNNNYSGNVVLGLAGTNAASAVVNVNKVLGSAAWTINNAKWTVNFNNVEHTLKSLNGTATDAIVQGSGRVVVGSGDYAGKVAGALRVTKNSSGTLRLSGTNTYAGGTVISDGILVAANAAALGAGTLAIDSGATLKIGDAAGITLSGITTLTSAGTILFTDQAAKIELSAYNFTAGSNIDLNGLFAAAGDYTLFDITGTGTGDNNIAFINTATDRGYSFSQGVLTVTAIPEPSTYAIAGAVLIAGLALVRRRQRRK